MKNKVVDHWGYMYSSQQIDDVIEVIKGADERRIQDRKRHDLHSNYFYLSTYHMIETIK